MCVESLFLRKTLLQRVSSMQGDGGGMRSSIQRSSSYDLADHLDVPAEMSKKTSERVNILKTPN